MKKVFPASITIICMCLMVCAAALAYGVNDKVNVEWKGGVYPATILQVKAGKYLIHYDDYASSWDEWVTEDRIKGPAVPGFAVGDSIQVYWNDKWYPAKVMQVNNGAYLIHYEGYASSWDEWVGPGRMKR